MARLDRKFAIAVLSAKPWRSWLVNRPARFFKLTPKAPAKRGLFGWRRGKGIRKMAKSD